MRSNAKMQLLQLIPLLFIAQCFSLNQSNVNYFVNLLTNSLEEARRFKLPKDAWQFITLSHQTYFGEYDYIVIGAGSAGAAVANRLSEEKQWKVLVLEAGKFENNFTDIPLMLIPAEFTDYNWGYESIPQKTACLGMVHQKCPYPRGKGVGGTSLLNGLMYVRPNRGDFDRWASEGNPGWSYGEVLPYLKKFENVTIPNAEPDYHGKGGPLNVEYNLPFSRHLQAFLDAGIELGYNVVDYNGRSQIGVAPTQFNTINGRRLSTGKAYINPALNRPNFKVQTNSYVTRIIINKNREAVGVEFSNNNQLYCVFAKKEIILSAGAINSPQILQLSGIGPRKLLEKNDVNVIQDLDVGTTLLDHPGFFGAYFDTNYTDPIRSVKEYVEDYVKGFGPLSIPGNTQGVGFFQTHLARYPNVPDLEMIFVPANSTSEFSTRALNFKNETGKAMYGSINPTKTFGVYIITLQALSKGSVKIKTKNPFDYPEIDSRFLSDPANHDIDVIYAGIELLFKIINTTAFRKINARYAPKPLPACSKHKFMSKSYWYCAIRQVTMNVYHPVGSCKMGPDPKKGAVVDNKLRVYGVKNLRVADASIFPFTFAGHPSVPSILVGEILADLIKRKISFPNNYVE